MFPMRGSFHGPGGKLVVLSLELDLLIADLSNIKRNTKKVKIEKRL